MKKLRGLLKKERIYLTNFEHGRKQTSFFADIEMLDHRP